MFLCAQHIENWEEPGDETTSIVETSVKNNASASVNKCNVKQIKISITELCLSVSHLVHCYPIKKESKHT